VLYDWIDGKNPSFSSGHDLQKAVEALARFHQASIGFVPAIPCRVSSNWGKWTNQYHTIVKQCDQWKHSRHFASLSHADQRHIKEIIDNGERAKILLSRSNYADWTQKKKKSICHLDFSERNIVVTKNKCVILDTDRAAYDLPIRDLRIVIHQEMQKKETWDTNLFHKMISWYTRKNPLTDGQLKLLYIDCFFPHELYETVIKPFMYNRNVSSTKLASAIHIELTKKKALAKMIR
jgi:spore coat protein I